MADLRVNLFGKQLAGPVIAASGTFGFGPEYAGIEDLRVLGGISGKGLTLNGQPGNDGERLLETPSGLMNSIGLQNPGVQHFIENELPAMKTCGTSVWVNLGGHTIEENMEGVQKLCAAGIDVLGENRVQEMTEKLAQGAYEGAPLHFIGHLQRNKVKQVVGKAALIQSVGSLPLLEAVLSLLRTMLEG